MKKRILVILAILVFASCGAMQAQKSWNPYIGCTDAELYSNWGRGGSSSYHVSKYGTTRTVWYHRNLLFGGTFPGYSGQEFIMNVLIIVRDGVVESINYH